MNEQFVCWHDRSHRLEPHPQFGWPRCTVDGAAPPYHQRPQYLPEDFNLGIYLPNPESSFSVMIEPGSGMVGVEAGEGRTLVYFEGYKIFLPSDLEDKPAYRIWHDALAAAASRMVTAYPTIACATPRNTDVFRVGTYWIPSAVFEIAETYRDTVNEWMAASRHVKETS